MSRGIEGRLCEEGEHQRHFVVPSFPSVENAVGRVSFSAIVTASVQSRNMGLLGSLRYRCGGIPLLSLFTCPPIMQVFFSGFTRIHFVDS